MVDSTPQKKHCKVCHEDIRVGARKCIHCDSYQDWRRLLTMSSSVLALLVALVSVSSTTIPQIAEIFEKEYSSANIQSHGVKGQNIEIVIQNSGSREAFFAGASLTAEGKEPIRLEELGMSFPFLPKSPRSLLLFVPFSKVQEFLEWSEDRPTEASVNLKLKNYDGTLTDTTLYLDGDLLSSLEAGTKNAYDQEVNKRSQILSGS